MCKILIPGMDYNLCEKCGYVPTQWLLESVESEIEEAEERKRVSKVRGIEKKIIGLRATLKELKAKAKNHDMSARFEDGEYKTAN